MSSRRRIHIVGDWRKNGPDREWAGTGTVDQFGAIECSANLDGDAYEQIEEQIQDGQTKGSVTVPSEEEDARSVTYYWSIED